MSHTWRAETPFVHLERGSLAGDNDAFVVWSTAEYSLDVHGAFGPVRNRSEDPRVLGGGEFIRFEALLRSDPSAQLLPAIEEIRLPYRFGE